jgi:hypothetical protein
VRNSVKVFMSSACALILGAVSFSAHAEVRGLKAHSQSAQAQQLAVAGDRDDTVASISGSDPRPKPSSSVASISGSDPRPKPSSSVASISGSDPRPKPSSSVASISGSDPRPKPSSSSVVTAVVA